MRLLFTTDVEQSYKDVAAGFTFDLFQKLTPPNVSVEIKRFDGCDKGDEVHLAMRVPVFNRTEEWTSRVVKSGEVTGHEVYSDEWYFIDEGVKLPFFLTYWRHVHRVVQTDSGGSAIIDDIEYRALWYLQPFVHLVLLGQFAARQPIYREYFRKK